MKPDESAFNATPRKRPPLDAAFFSLSPSASTPPSQLTPSVRPRAIFCTARVTPSTDLASMTKDAELRAKIAALEGRVQTKRAEPYPSPSPRAPHHPYAARGTGRSGYRGRGSRAGYYQHSQHRVWVAGGTQTPPSAESTPVPRADVPKTPPAGHSTQNGFYIPQNGVGKRELMSKETYEREQKLKQEYQQSKALKAPPKQTPPTPKPPAQVNAEQSSRQILIDKIAFQVSNDGSKLVRISGE